jgi:hypothetical protein
MVCAGEQHRGLIEKRHVQYRFSILLIDDKPRIGLHALYRNTMRPIKENDMPRLANTALAACAAIVLSLSSIGAIVTVPPAHAATAGAALAMPELA